MAKKTAKKPATPKKKPAPKQLAAKKPVKKKPAKKRATPVTKPPTLSDESIGYAAGAVWGALNDGDEMTLAAIKKATDAPDDATLMAIGWLAREGKIAFNTSGRSVKLSLR